MERERERDSRRIGYANENITNGSKTKKPNRIGNTKRKEKTARNRPKENKKQTRRVIVDER